MAKEAPLRIFVAKPIGIQCDVKWIAMSTRHAPPSTLLLPFQYAMLKHIVFRQLQRVASRLGIDMVQISRMGQLPQARYLRRVFETFGVTGVVDVGANEGQYRGFLRSDVGFDGAIVSVEPIPKLATRLRKAAEADGSWIIEELAMGRESGSLSFNVTSGSQFSSFLSPIKATSELFSGQNHVEESISVKVERLANLFDRHRDFLGPRVYLKLDTQGYDLEALSGLGDASPRVVALQSEASVRPIYEGMPSYGETISFIEALGFTLSQIFPNNDGHFPLLIEFDCHFVKLGSTARS